MRYIVGAFVIIALLAGVYARFEALNARPLAVDEYYFVRSIESVLEHGLPVFLDGGYYIQGIIPQYLSAGLTRVAGESITACRMVSVFFGLLSIPLAFLYARRFMSDLAAAAVSATLLVSSWHIEFSYFIRMYPAFQAATLAYLISLDHVFFRGGWKWRYLPPILLLLTVLTHLQAVLLAPLLFLPVLQPRSESVFPTWRRLAPFLFVSFAVTLVCARIATFNFRQWGVTGAFPDDFNPVRGQRFRTGLFPFWNLSQSDTASLAAALIVLAAIGLMVFWMRRGRPSLPVDVLAAIALASAVLHCFAITVIAVAALVFRYDLLNPKAHPRRTYVLLATAALISAGWLTFGAVLAQKDPLVLAGEMSLGGFLRRAFFGWPDFYENFWGPWLRELPFLSVLLAGSLAYQLWSKCKEPLHRFLSNPSFVLLYLMFCLAVIWTRYSTTRYSFFIYPVILTVLALTLAEIAPKLRLLPHKLRAAPTGAVIYLAAFCVSSDFNPGHIARIDTEEVTFRTGRFEKFADTWYPRPDFMGPATFLNRIAAAEAEEAKIVILRNPAVSYYLLPEHAVYFDRDNVLFQNVSRRKGTVDLWSHQTLLSTPEDLARYTQGSNRVWVIQSTNPDQRPVLPQEVWTDRLEEIRQAYLSKDGRLEVLEILLR